MNDLELFRLALESQTYYILNDFQSNESKKSYYFVIKQILYLSQAVSDLKSLRNYVELFMLQHEVAYEFRFYFFGNPYKFQQKAYKDSIELIDSHIKRFYGYSQEFKVA